MAEKIHRSGVRISHDRLFISILPSILGRPQRCNFRLMLIRSFRYGVLDCSKYKNSEIFSIMEITGGVGINRLVPSACMHTILVFLKIQVWYKSDKSSVE
ncbi:unnamed protein product [Rotaria socialis]|uniref:Uncharacterized protein n=1 Tax=Rotaria socialis TaxID=392032 RepID=A0A820J581_9BILA|nr:unnamed protein product [Rotaria socialis]CAF4443969.1 unnamed protein product [Rotaria socialis]CAF4648352.1 unnamed protein product [Rotaria socialis]